MEVVMEEEVLVLVVSNVAEVVEMLGQIQLPATAIVPHQQLLGHHHLAWRH